MTWADPSVEMFLPDPDKPCDCTPSGLPHLGTEHYGIGELAAARAARADLARLRRIEEAARDVLGLFDGLLTGPIVDALRQALEGSE